MEIGLIYTRRAKPRGGYGYGLQFHLHFHGTPRGWRFEWRQPLGPMWLSLTPDLEYPRVPDTSWAQWVYVERLPGQRADLGLPYGGLVLHVRSRNINRCRKEYCREMVSWYTRTAQERERLIEAFHQAVEAARQSWMQFWRNNPPVPGDAHLTRQMIALPAPEDIYFASGARQYAWEDDEN
jgi:hypothetical protein